MVWSNAVNEGQKNTKKILKWVLLGRRLEEDVWRDQDTWRLGINGKECYNPNAYINKVKEVL